MHHRVYKVYGVIARFTEILLRINDFIEGV